jgi:hypothetical protein
LWRLSGSGWQASGYAYSPRAANVSRRVIWDDMHTVRARIDTTHYPVPAFVAPAAWQGNGWRPDGSNLARTGATLTSAQLDMRRGAVVPVPFSRDCTTAPQFQSFRASTAPRWSDIDGLWRPIPTGFWKGLKAWPGRSMLQTRFVPAAKPPQDGVEFVEVRAPSTGTFRLLGACPNAHFGSVAVAWLNVVVH